MNRRNFLQRATALLAGIPVLAKIASATGSLAPSVDRAKQIAHADEIAEWDLPIYNRQWALISWRRAQVRHTQGFMSDLQINQCWRKIEAKYPGLIPWPFDYYRVEF